MKEYFLIYQGRALIKYEALFFFGLDLDSVNELLKQKTDTKWDFIYRSSGSTQSRYIFLDTVPENVREQYKIPSSQDVLRNEESHAIDVDNQKDKEIAKLRIFIEHDYKSYMQSEDKVDGTNFIRYISEGFSQVEAKTMSRIYGLLLVCLRLNNDFGIENIYHALSQLREENKDNNKYAILYDPKSVRTFYEHIRKASKNGIDSVVIHGLVGKSGNRRSICESTRKLTVELLSHFNNQSDKIVKDFANTIIIALPNKYNNGRIISRQKVNQIKNGEYKSLIKARIHGQAWIRDNFTPDIHRVETQFALDRVEVDFTKVHAAMVDDQGNKTKKFVCRIRDSHSRAILGESSGRSECFDLFQIAFRRMLNKTGSLLPAELVYDRSPAFSGKEFERIKGFMNSLYVETTETRNCQAKGGIESHFKTLLEVYMPQYVGTLGGNVATTKRHRPKHEILVLLEKKEYLEEEDKWEGFLKEINNKYNTTPSSDQEIDPPISRYHNSEKPHSVRIEGKYVAYLSWHHTYRTFSQAEFPVHFDGKTFIFGWPEKEINESVEKQKFVTERVGDIFDIYMDPVCPTHIHVFERGTLKYVNQFPLKERYYGNKVDQKIDPTRRTALRETLHQRNMMKKNLQKQIAQISKEVEKDLGADLFSVIKDIQKKADASGKKEDVMENILDMLGNRDVVKIDPFKSAVQKPLKKIVPRTLFKPTTIKHKAHGK
jgi:transposase InsO family protein